jgi:hypothetical protein
MNRFSRAEAALLNDASPVLGLSALGLVDLTTLGVRALSDLVVLATADLLVVPAATVLAAVTIGLRMALAPVKPTDQTCPC